MLARAIGLIRAVALGPSAMLTASMPFCLSFEIHSITSMEDAPFGGSISIHFTNSPFTIFAANRDFRSSGISICSVLSSFRVTVSFFLGVN